MNFLLRFIPLLAALSLGSKALAEPDAARGYSYLVNGGYIGCGVPVSVMKRAVAAKGVVPGPVIPTFFPLAAEQLFLDSPILPGRNADNRLVAPSMNVFETSRGIKAMNYNCLSCHGEYLGDNFIVGLGNRTRDYTQDIRRMAKLLPILAWTPAEREETKAFIRAADTIGPYIQTKTVGVNPAINLTYALFSKRNAEDFTWSEDFTLDPPGKDFPPVDVPPWWRMGLKHSMFYNAEFKENHHRIMTLASTLCVEGKEDMLALEEPFLDVEAFIKSIPSPRYPKSINRELASEGEAIFQKNCRSCHGSYGADSFYPEITVPIEVIGTDPWLMEQQTGPEHERFRAWGERAFLTIYGERFGADGFRGYLAPPLNGIWATAPFFHNGSVPTLEAVLNSKKRPRYWQKTSNSAASDYDVETMSVKHNVLNHGQKAFLIGNRYIYDTTLKGYNNQGHTFGDRLNDVERKALIEYLKSL